MKLIDLSTGIYPGMPKPKSAPETLLNYVLSPSEQQQKEQGFTNNMEEYTICAHVATHIDAPSHFNYYGKNIDEYPAGFFYLVDTQLLNIEREAYGIITALDIQAAEAVDGEIKKDDLVLINTGCHRLYGQSAYNQAPYLTKDAAEYLAAKQVRMVGTDSFTVDDPRVKAKPAHVVLLCENEIPIIECVMNLSSLPCTRFKTVCLPLKMQHASGAFTRMVAVCEEEIHE